MTDGRARASVGRSAAEAGSMLSANNLLKPQDGKPVTVPTQDMVLGVLPDN